MQRTAMRKSLLVVLFLLITTSPLLSQEKFIPSVGVELNVLLKNSNPIGLGFHFNSEYLFSDRFSTTLTAGFNRFNGEVVYWDGSKDNSFSLIPLFLGCRYKLHSIYGGLEAGLVIKGSRNAATLPALSPSIGFLLKKLDVSGSLTSVLGMPSYPENTFLKRGGYSYCSIRISYQLK